MTEVQLPDSLHTIDEYAFFDNQLTEVSFPNLIQKVGKNIFCHNPPFIRIHTSSFLFHEEEVFHQSSSLS